MADSRRNDEWQNNVSFCLIVHTQNGKFTIQIHNHWIFILGTRVVLVVKNYPMGTQVPDGSTTRDQKHFTILQVAAEWHELMIPQRIVAIHCPH